MSIRWWSTAALALAAASCAELPSDNRQPPPQDEAAIETARERKILASHGLTPERAAQQGYREIVRTSTKAENGLWDVTDVCYTKRSDAELKRLEATRSPRDKRTGSPDALHAELCARDVLLAESAVERAGNPTRKAALVASNDESNSRDTEGYRWSSAQFEQMLAEEAGNAAEFLREVRSGDLDRIARARDRFSERKTQITEKYGQMRFEASQKFAAAQRDAPSGGASVPGADDGLPTLSCEDARPRAAAYVKKRDVSVSCSSYVLALMLKACRATLIEEGAKPASIDKSYNQSLDVAEKFLNGDRFRCEGWPSAQILRRATPAKKPRRKCSPDSPPGTCFR